MKIKIIAGTYGYHEIVKDEQGTVLKDEKGNVRTKLRPKNKGDVIEVDDEEAKRLVDMNIAEYIEEASESTDMVGSEASPVMDPAEEVPEGSDTDSEGEELDLDNMTVEQLKARANEMGIKTSKLRTKKDLIDAINEASVELPEA